MRVRQVRLSPSLCQRWRNPIATRRTAYKYSSINTSKRERRWTGVAATGRRRGNAVPGLWVCSYRVRSDGGAPLVERQPGEAVGARAARLILQAHPPRVAGLGKLRQIPLDGQLSRAGLVTAGASAI